jgi:hypothetical protein
MPLAMVRYLPAAVVLAGCASGRAVDQGGGDIDAAVGGADAKIYLDGQIEGMPDAPTVTPAPDAAIDAGPPPCIVVTSQLLANPVFDLTPVGTGWQQVPIDAQYPPITSDGPAAQTAPYKVWLGGFEAPTFGGSVTDVVYQDVAIPATTTELKIRGYYWVGTQETTTTSTFDTGSLALIQTNGTPIESVLALSNLSAAGMTGWTLFEKTFTANVAGQTVRLRLTSSNDYFLVTNFFFDSFALEATHCQ